MAKIADVIFTLCVRVFRNAPKIATVVLYPLFSESSRKVLPSQNKQRLFYFSRSLHENTTFCGATMLTLYPSWLFNLKWLSQLWHE